MLAEQIAEILKQGYRIHFKPDMNQVLVGVTTRKATLVEQALPHDHLTDEKISGCLEFCMNKIDELKAKEK